MTTDTAGLGGSGSHLSHLWCYSAIYLHLSSTSSAISVVNCVYIIALGFGPAQLRVSFAVVKGLTHDSRFVAFS